MEVGQPDPYRDEDEADPEPMVVIANAMDRRVATKRATKFESLNEDGLNQEKLVGFLRNVQCENEREGRSRREAFRFLADHVAGRPENGQ